MRAQKRVVLLLLAVIFVFFGSMGLLYGIEIGHQNNLDSTGNLVIAQAPTTTETGPSADEVKASVSGKYSNLLNVLYIPGDQGSYGDFYDWGYWTGDSWGSYTNLPPGYWVYVYPNWYIWGNLTSDVPTTDTSTDEVKASLSGKYYNLQKILYIPGDQGSYGDFYEWGYWTGDSWGGYTNLPPGYWVYVYPNWYIWGNSR